MKFMLRSFIIFLAIMLTACTGVGTLEPINKNISSNTPYFIESVEVIDVRSDIVDIQNIDTPNSFFRGNDMASALNSKLTSILKSRIKSLVKEGSNPNGLEVEILIDIKKARKTYYSYFWSEFEKVEVELDMQAIDRSGAIFSKSEGSCMMSMPVWNASAESINNKIYAAFDCAISNALYAFSHNDAAIQDKINE